MKRLILKLVCCIFMLYVSLISEILSLKCEFFILMIHVMEYESV